MNEQAKPAVPSMEDALTDAEQVLGEVNTMLIAAGWNEELRLKIQRIRTKAQLALGITKPTEQT